MLELLVLFFVLGRFTVMMVPAFSWEQKVAAWVKKQVK